jgi:predicted ATPase/DNA-binding CsgD family transcriptional regulator
MQAAADLREDFADDICFISLAPLSHPDLVLPTLAQIFGLKETPGWLPLEHLKAYLREKQLLLLLDNFEQVITAAPLLVALLQVCPALKMLVTSRARLRISGEFEFHVPPLALPDLHHLPDHANLLGYAAIALFVQRAQAIKPSFLLTAGNDRTIAEICLHLDGLPLALELAAARIKLLSPQALLARLSQRLQVLTDGVQDAPIRQQTLRNTIAWSYDLLDATEQRLFRRLAVFVGSCTLEAIEAICATLDEDNSVIPVLDGVISLLDKSLLQQIEREGGEPCLMMLETIREYAQEASASSGEMEDTRWAHAGYYLRMAEEAEPELIGPLQTVWLDRLEREHDNLRAAIQWLLEQEGTQEGREMAWRLGGALLQFWDVRGHWSEGWSFLEWALAAREGVAASEQAQMLRVAGRMALYRDDYERAEMLCEESLVLCRQLGDIQGIAHSLHLLAWAARERGNWTEANSLFEEALALRRRLGNKEDIAWSLFGLARVLFFSQGDLAKVLALLEEGLALCRGVGHKSGIAWALSYLGEGFLQQGETAQARLLLEESVALSREIGNRRSKAESLFVLGRVAKSLGDYAAARAYYEESLAIRREVGNNLSISSYLEGLADVVAARGDPAWAARLWGIAEALREAMRIPIPPVYCADYDRSVAAARAQLGETAFASAWAEGRTMTPEQALTAQGAATSLPSTPTEATSTAPAKTALAYPAGLTAREMEVLRLVAQGMTNPQIAERLILSLHTVNAHVRSIYTKLELNSRSALTRYAVEHHLL